MKLLARTIDVEGNTVSRKRISVRLSAFVATVTALAVVVAAAPAWALVGADRDNDYNHDGYSDLVAIRFGTVGSPGFCHLYEWPGTTSGTLGSATDRFALNSASYCWDPGTAFYEWQVESVATTGDLNGDNRGDIVVLDKNRGLHTYFSSGNGVFSTGPVSSIANIEIDRIVGIGDMTGDGKADMIALNHDDLTVLVGDGTGRFTAGYLVGGGGWQFEYAGFTGAADINGDGYGDIVAVDHFDGCLYKFTRTANGGDFNNRVQIGTSCTWDPYTEISGMHDMNADGHPDLVGINSNNGCLYRWYGTSNGGYTGATQLGCNWDPYLLGA